MHRSITLLAAGAVLALGAPLLSPASARADIISAGNHNSCLTVASNKVYVYSCGRGDSQNWAHASYGAQQYHNLCLDIEKQQQGAQLVMVPCVAGKATQYWMLEPNGEFANNGGYIADVQGGSVHDAVPVIVWPRNNQVNQRWAGVQTVSPAALPPTVVAALKTYPKAVATAAGVAKARADPKAKPEDVLAKDASGKIVAQGGGNIVAQGGGNFAQTTGGAVAGGS